MIEKLIKAFLINHLKTLNTGGSVLVTYNVAGEILTLDVKDTLATKTYFSTQIKLETLENYLNA